MKQHHHSFQEMIFVQYSLFFGLHQHLRKMSGSLAAKFITMFTSYYFCLFCLLFGAYTHQATDRKNNSSDKL